MKAITQIDSYLTGKPNLFRFLVLLVYLWPLVLLDGLSFYQLNKLANACNRLDITLSVGLTVIAQFFFMGWLMSNFHAPRDNSSIEMSKDIYPLFRLLLAFFGAIAVLFFLSFASPLSFLGNGRGRVEGGTVLSVLYVLSVVFFGFWRWGIPIAHAAIKPNWLSNTWSAVLLISIVAFLLCIAIRPESEEKIRSELTSRINISLNEFPQEKQKHVYALQAVLATGYKNNVIFTGKDFLEIVVDSEVGTWCQPEGGNVVNRILGMDYLSTSTHIRSKYESDKDAATTAANCNRLAKEAAEKFEFAVSVAQHLCAQRNLVDC